MNRKLIYEEEEEENGGRAEIIRSVFTAQQELLIPVVNQHIVSRLQSFTITQEEVESYFDCFY